MKVATLALTICLLGLILFGCRDSAVKIKIDAQNQLLIEETREGFKSQIVITKIGEERVTECANIRLRNTVDPLFLINVVNGKIILWHGDYVAINKSTCEIEVHRLMYSDLIAKMKNSDRMAGVSYRYCHHCTEGFKPLLHQ